MNAAFLRCIVEGHGEQVFMNKFLQRIWIELLGQSERLATLDPPDRFGHASIVDRKTGRPDVQLIPRVLAAVNELALLARKDADAPKLVLILIDSDGADPVPLEKALAAGGQAAVPASVVVECVLAHHEFETWFAASAASLANVDGLPADLLVRPDPETIPIRKKWLTDEYKRADPSRLIRSRETCPNSPPKWTSSPAATIRPRSAASATFYSASPIDFSRPPPTRLRSFRPDVYLSPTP